MLLIWSATFRSYCQAPDFGFYGRRVSGHINVVVVAINDDDARSTSQGAGTFKGRALQYISFWWRPLKQDMLPWRPKAIFFTSSASHRTPLTHCGGINMAINGRLSKGIFFEKNICILMIFCYWYLTKWPKFNRYFFKIIVFFLTISLNSFTSLRLTISIGLGAGDKPYQ